MKENEIFEAKQILSLYAAEQLIGKRIAITSEESRYNRATVKEFTVKGFVSEWDKAANEECSGFANRQEYWSSYMTPERVNELKETLLIVTDHDIESYWDKVAVRCHNYMQSVFTGSDSDRFVYYVVIDEN